MRTVLPRQRFPAFAVALIVLSWVAVLGWDASPYGRFLHHGDWTPVGVTARVCAAVPGGDWLIPAILYVGGWTLMTAAMMLPTVLPLIRLFDRIIVRRPDRHVLHVLLITGYLGAWGVFGVAAHALDTAFHTVAGRSNWLTENSWVAAAAILSIAGLFQFSTLKHHCLDQCRAPLGFLLARWRGSQPRREAAWIGIAHGIFCVGCCWALMLLMFLVGTGNVAWMLLLGMVMAAEKNHAWGSILSVPLGAILLGLSGVIVAAHL